MFDVDFFKKYNDRYGHLAGDECLRKVAEAFRSRLRRPGDLAARYGGEEFVVVLPGLDLAQCGEWAESARKAIYDLALPHDDHPEGRLTVSAGAVSIIPARDESILELIRLADECLYRAKAAGRNRIVLGE
jgi:diguanylate cyclase (GGDEF)-like protein